MDILSLFFGIFDFAKISIIISIIAFILFKGFFKIKQKLNEDYNLSWMKSVLLINFVSVFVIFFFIYLYFMFVGFAGSNLNNVELEYTIFERLILVGLATIRIIIATIIVSLGLLFFELIASFVIEFQKEKEYSKTVKEFVGVLVASALFLFLLLFFFNWVPLGLFVYIFYGSIGEMPLLLPLLIT